MPLADGFWEIKNLNDTIAVVGLVLTLFSIWYAWWLAKRDIEKRISAAQHQVTERILKAVLQNDVTETGRLLREAREYCRLGQWLRVLDRCEQAMHRIPRFRYLPSLDPGEGEQLGRVVDQLRLLIRQIEDVNEMKRATLTSNKIRDLENMIVFLATVEGRMWGTGLR